MKFQTVWNLRRKDLLDIKVNGVFSGNVLSRITVEKTRNLNLIGGLAIGRPTSDDPRFEYERGEEGARQKAERQAGYDALLEKQRLGTGGYELGPLFEATPQTFNRGEYVLHTQLKWATSNPDRSVRILQLQVITLTDQKTIATLDVTASTPGRAAPNFDFAGRFVRFSADTPFQNISLSFSSPIAQQIKLVLHCDGIGIVEVGRTTYNKISDSPNLELRNGSRFRIKSAANNQYICASDGLNNNQWLYCKGGTPLVFVLKGNPDNATFNVEGTNLYLSYNSTTGAVKLWNTPQDANFMMEKIGRGELYNIKSLRYNQYVWLSKESPYITRAGERAASSGQWYIERL